VHEIHGLPRRYQLASSRAGEFLRRIRAPLLASVFCACLGGTVGLGASSFSYRTPHVETKITVRDASEQSIDAAIAQMRSKPSLDNLIQALDLAGTEEFAVNPPTVINVMREVLSGEVTTMTQAEHVLRQRLLDAITIRYDRMTQTVSLNASVSDLHLATAIVERLREDFSRALIRQIATAPDPQVDALQKAAARAGAALTGFLARYDEAGLARLHRLQDDLTTVDADIAAAQAQLADLKEKHQAASSMAVADVLDASLPDSLDYTGLEYERERYLAAQQALMQLAVQLGPRHPRHIAAQAAVDDARQGIAQALRQLKASLLSQIAGAEQAVTETSARKRAANADTKAAEEAKQLALLQKAAEEARRNRDAAEKSARSTSAVKLPVISVVSPAMLASADQPYANPLTLVGLGAGAGLFLGIAIADYRRRKQMKLAQELDEQDIELPVPVELSLSEVGDVVMAEEEILLPDDVQEEWDEDPTEEETLVAANDGSSFGDRMRALLMDNRHPADAADLPPLLEATVATARSVPIQSHDLAGITIADEREIEEIWQQIAALRRMVELQETEVEPFDIGEHGDQTACISRSAAA
jgi:uncharacterized protein involved in exopolysaccharide biosynthesis